MLNYYPKCYGRKHWQTRYHHKGLKLMINLVCVLLDYFSKTHFVLSVYYCDALQYFMGYTDYCLAQNFDGENYVLKLTVKI